MRKRKHRLLSESNNSDPQNDWLISIKEFCTKKKYANSDSLNKAFQKYMTFLQIGFDLYFSFQTKYYKKLEIYYKTIKITNIPNKSSKNFLKEMNYFSENIFKWIISLH